MKFEASVGLRYLVGARRGRGAVIALAVGLAITGIGIAMLALSTGANPIAAAVLITGVIATVVTGLLATFSVFVSVSVLGVALGVAAMVIVLAVTTGFQREFRDKVLGVNAHVVVQKAAQTFGEYRDVMRTAKSVDPDVVAVQPFIFAEMLVTTGGGRLSGVAIKGIDPALVKGVLDLDRYMVSGSIDALQEKDAIILGRELAFKLRVKVGDRVTVVVPLSNIDLENYDGRSAPRQHVFHVAGIFYAGFAEYDNRLMYASLVDTQTLIGRGDQAMGVELKVRDLDRAQAIAKRLERALGGMPFQAQDWYEMNENLFAALSVQKLALVILLTLIIIVAAVNMVSALIMMVTDKTREIAILKSMGADSGRVARIFIVVGAAIGGVGTVVGVGLGLVLCVVMARYGFALDPKMYFIDHLPIDVRPLEVLLVSGITMAVALLATIAPALGAANLRPVEGLRYD